MVKLIAAALCIAIVGVCAEPPSSYLPPQARNQPSGRYGAPQQQPDSRYGAPSGRYNAPDPTARFGSQSRSTSYNSIAENQFGGSQKSSFRSRSFGQQQQQSGGFGGQARQNGNSYSRQSAPSQQYGAPGQHQGPAQQYNAPAQQYNAPAQQYNAPAQQYSAPRNFAAQPSSQYGAPRNNFGQQPSSQYGAPRNAPSSEYGAPFARKMDDDLAEPANYEYNYEVQALDESGAEFGHQETREDDSARGEYHVLLPDGRMQIVEYEADEEGFRPRIRYEETGAYPEARNGPQGPY